MKFTNACAMNKDFPPNVVLNYEPERGDEARAMAHSLLNDGMPADAVEIYRARNLVVITSDGKYCIKSFKIPDFFKGCVYGFMRLPKTRRAWLNAQQLKNFGIFTPAPVLSMEVHRAGLLGASWYVTEALHGWSTLRGVEKRDDFPALAKALAAFMLQLHEKGIFMRDFTPGNILFKQKRGEYLFCLVDINRMHFGESNFAVLLGNFGSPLDTRAGVAVLVKEYARLCAAQAVSGWPASAEVIERKAMEAYEKRQAFMARKRRLKQLVKRKN